MGFALTQTPQRSNFDSRVTGPSIKTNSNSQTLTLPTVSANADSYSPGGNGDLVGSGTPKLKDLLKVVNPSANQIQGSGEFSKEGDVQLKGQATRGSGEFSAGYEKTDNKETFTAEATRKQGGRSTGVRFQQDAKQKIVELFAQTENGSVEVEHRMGERGDSSTLRAKRTAGRGSVGSSVQRDEDSTKFGVSYERESGNKGVYAEATHDSRDGVGVGVTFKMTV